MGRWSLPPSQDLYWPAILRCGQVHYVQTNATAELVFIQTAWDLSESELEQVRRAMTNGPLAAAPGPEVAVKLTGATVHREGSPCHLVAVGAEHDGRFVADQHYAVDLDSRAHTYNTARGWGKQHPG